MNSVTVRLAHGLTSTASNNTTSAAVFGQATLHLTDQWSLTGGLRYTYDGKNGRFDQLVGGGAPLTGALAPLAALRLALAAPASYKEKLNDNHVSGQVNLTYRATENLLAYATAARGYKSGGINLTQLPPGASSVIDAEKIDSFEVGVKILSLVQALAGGPAQAMTWYRSEPIPAFDGRTAEALVSSGEATAVRDYVEHLVTGGYA